MCKKIFYNFFRKSPENSSEKSRSTYFFKTEKYNTNKDIHKTTVCFAFSSVEFFALWVKVTLHIVNQSHTKVISCLDFSDQLNLHCQLEKNWYFLFHICFEKSSAYIFFHYKRCHTIPLCIHVFAILIIIIGHLWS